MTEITSTSKLDELQQTLVKTTVYVEQIHARMITLADRLMGPHVNEVAPAPAETPPGSLIRLGIQVEELGRKVGLLDKELARIEGL